MIGNIYTYIITILISTILIIPLSLACSGGKDTTSRIPLEPTSPEVVSTNPPHSPAATSTGSDKLDLSIGQKWVFEYLEGNVAIGTDECRIAAVSQGTSSIKYKINSSLKLASNSIWGAYESHAYLTVDEFLSPSAYNAVEAMGCSSCQSTQQLVECSIEGNIASTSVWDNASNETVEKVTILEPMTFLSSEKAVTWLAMIYRVLPLTKGESITIPIFYPDSATATEMQISVREDTEVISAGSNTYEAFICDVESPAQIHYVNSEGQLLKVECPEDDIVIRLFSD